MADQEHLDPLGDLIQAGLEIERMKNASIERLSAEIIRLTRAIGQPYEIPASVWVHMRVPAVVECTCCSACGCDVPCSESIEGQPCADRCVCDQPAAEE
ncbi:MAG: hypothetical protein GXY23_04645 [Myxococcales bacterium]|nr:hypothetical protein [Myxococcales bacterium]